MFARKLFFVAIAAFALLLFAYGNHFHNDFHFSDRDRILSDDSLDYLRNPARFLYEPRPVKGNQTQIYQPLADLSFALDRSRAESPRPNAFHLSAFSYYCLTLVAIFLVYIRVLGLSLAQPLASWTALTATCLYAFHTVNAETLNYLGARGTLLAGLCFALTVYLYSLGRFYRNSRLYLIPLAAGILCSIEASAAALIIFLYQVTYESELREPAPRRLKRAILSALPAISVSVIGVLFVAGMSSPSLIQNAAAESLLTQPYAYLRYLTAFFIPFALNADPKLGIFSEAAGWHAPAGYLFLVSWIVLSGVFLKRSETRCIGFGMLWFLLAFLPTSLFPPNGEPLDYRRTFIAYPGLALAVCAAGGLALNRLKSAPWWKVKYYAVATGTLLIIFGFHILGVRSRNRVWQNEETLWLDVTIKEPLNGAARMNYALAKMAQGDYDIARIYFEQSLALSPNSAEVNSNLGTIYGRSPEKSAVADAYFKRALQLEPLNAHVHARYGAWLLRRKLMAQAIEQLDRAKELDPNFTQPRYSLFEAYATLGRWSKVREEARALLAINPNDQVAKKQLEQADIPSRPKRPSP